MSQLNLIKSGKGKALLLLHGFGFDHHIFNTLLPHLNQTYQVYQVDLPGFGETPFMAYEQFQSELLKELPNKIALLGWSMGGLFATRFALENPERVSSLINLASSPYFVEETNWPGIDAVLLDMFYLQIQLSPFKILQEFLALQMPKSHTLPTLIGFSDASIRGLKSGLEILKTWDFRDELHHLTMPVAYLFGRLDRIVPINTIKTMQTRYPEFSYLQLQKAGHAPFLSHPKHCLDFIHHCLKDIST